MNAIWNVNMLVVGNIFKIIFRALSHGRSDHVRLWTSRCKWTYVHLLLPTSGFDQAHLNKWRRTASIWGDRIKGRRVKMVSGVCLLLAAHRAKQVLSMSPLQKMSRHGSVIRPALFDQQGISLQIPC